MSFHPQKCYTLSATRKKETIVPSYHLHGHNLQTTSTAKYLGENIQDNLNWGLHIDTITNKANKTLGFLRRNLKIGNKKTKETAYKAFAAQSWSTRPHSANNIKTIEKVQRRAARWVTNRHHQTSCVNSIIDSLAWPTLKQRRKKLDLKCFIQISPPPRHHWFWIPTTTNRNQIKPQKEQHTQLQHPLLQDTVQTDVILPPDHPRMEHVPQDIVAAKSLNSSSSFLRVTA